MTSTGNLGSLSLDTWPLLGAGNKGSSQSIISGGIEVAAVGGLIAGQDLELVAIVFCRRCVFAAARDLEELRDP
jgi:hypothetical protein